MAAASYVPGGWLGLIRSGTVVILDPATPVPLVSTVWDMLAGRPDAAEVLHAVAGGLGAPLSASPWFGIIGYSESLRVFLRGDIDLTVQLPSGPVTLDGRNVTTWTERWLDAPEWFSVAVAAAAVPTVQALPVVEGAVLLQSLCVSVTGPGSSLTGAPDNVAISSEASSEASAETMMAPGEDLPLTAGAGDEASAETVVGLQETVTGFTEAGAVPPGTPPEDAPPHEALPQDAPNQEVPVQAAPALEDNPATELTGSYDHLWDKTVVRSIEDAAVRTGQEDDGGAPAVGETAVPGTAGRETGDPDTAGQGTAVPAPPSAPSPAGLIDSVPWATGGGRAPAREVPASFAGAQTPPSFIAVPGSGEAAEGDHDGQTILKSDLPTSGAQQAGQGQEPGQGVGAGTGPVVLARVCPGGHANPPTSGQCFTCGAQLPDVAVQVPRPRLGRLRLSTGELIELEQSLVIGRQPSVSRVQGGTMPRLVQVASPGGDISRSHVEVRLEGWHVMLCDLKATNGTVLVRVGQPPRRLAQNEMAIVLDGDIAELGDDVSLRFEEIL